MRTYYLSYKAGGLISLILLMSYWAGIFRENLKYLKTTNTRKSSEFNFKYLNRGVIIPVAVIGLTCSSQQLYAPAMFIELYSLCF